MEITNPKGQPIKLTSYQKNEIYAKAKVLREQLKDSLCTKRECERPTEQNVRKMIGSEFKSSPAMELYKKSMKAIGSNDPREFNPNNLRRR